VWLVFANDKNVDQPHYERASTPLLFPKARHKDLPACNSLSIISCYSGIICLRDRVTFRSTPAPLSLVLDGEFSNPLGVDSWPSWWSGLFVDPTAQVKSCTHHKLGKVCTPDRFQAHDLDKCFQSFQPPRTDSNRLCCLFDEERRCGFRW
jgi:hypothetical protein